MARVLTTKEIAATIDDIIKNAEKYICLFTFNITIGETYLSRLRNAAKRGVNITVVFGVDNGEPDLLKELHSIPGCEVYFKRYLHAKFYYNEKDLLVTSMNLSEASERNNYELGVHMNVKTSPDEFQKVKREAREIINDATLWTKLNQSMGNSSAKHRTDSKMDSPGKCVRCGKGIPYNPMKPLCVICYHEWSEWENEFYQENFCHNCGKEKAGISFAKPECPSCYRKSLVSF